MHWETREGDPQKWAVMSREERAILHRKASEYILKGPYEPPEASVTEAYTFLYASDDLVPTLNRAENIEEFALRTNRRQLAACYQILAAEEGLVDPIIGAEAETLTHLREEFAVAQLPDFSPEDFEN